MNKNKIIFLISIFFLVVTINFVLGEIPDCDKRDGQTPNTFTNDVTKCKCGTATCDSTNNYCCIFKSDDNKKCSASQITDCIPKPEQTGQGTFSFNYNSQCLVQSGCIIKDGKISCESTGGTTESGTGTTGGETGSLGDTGTTTGGDTGTPGGDTGTTTGGDTGTPGGDTGTTNEQPSNSEECGNNKLEGNEECDGTDSSKCPNKCNNECKCQIETKKCENGLKDNENLEQCLGDDKYINIQFKANKKFNILDRNFCPFETESSIYPDSLSLTFETDLIVQNSAFRDNDCWLFIEAQDSKDGYKPVFYAKLNDLREFFDNIEKRQTPKVENFKAEFSNNKIILTWNLNTEAEKYIIYRDNEKLTETTELIYEDTSIELNKKYKYEISAYNETYDIKESEKTAIEIETKINDLELIGFIKESYTDNSITLKWETNIEADKTTLFRDNKEIYTQNEKTFTDNNLEKDKCYSYKIIVEKDNNKIQKEDEFCTNDELQDITKFTFYPTENEIELEWKAKYPFGNFELYRSETPELNDKKLIYNGKNLNYLDKNLEKNKYYYYELTVKRKETSDTEILPAYTTEDYLIIRDFKANYEDNKVKITWNLLGKCSEITLLKNKNLLYKHQGNCNEFTEYIDENLIPGNHIYEIIALGQGKDVNLFAQEFYELKIN
ncbi:MAG: hypothetical protein QXM96_04250 [Candidatus Woesearchaeota archaeon]